MNAFETPQAFALNTRCFEWVRNLLWVNLFQKRSQKSGWNHVENSCNLPQIAACFDAKKGTKCVIWQHKMIGMTWKNDGNGGRRCRERAEKGTEMVFLFLFDDAVKCKKTDNNLYKTAGPTKRIFRAITFKAFQNKIKNSAYLNPKYQWFQIRALCFCFQNMLWCLFI